MKIFQSKSWALTISLVTVVALSLGVGWSVWPASAGPLVNGTSAFGEARSLARQMASQARGMVKLIAKIQIEFVEDVQEKIEQARDLIVTCSGSCAIEQHQASILIGQVLHQLDDFIELKFELLFTDIEQLLEDNGSLEGKINSLATQGKLQPSSEMSLQDKIDAINTLLHSLNLEIDGARALVEDGDEGEDPECDQTLSLPEDDDCDDIEDWLEIFLGNLTDLDSLNAALDIIETIIGFGTIPGELDTAMQKITKACPVGILSCLIGIDKTLRVEQRRNMYKFVNTTLTDSRALSVAWDKTNWRFDAGSSVTSGTVRLWAASGRLIGEYALEGASLALPWSAQSHTMPANGVYYYAVTLKNADGTVAQTTVRKLVLVR
jgi:hypothetical protein